jgi:hypothetical protein
VLLGKVVVVLDKVIVVGRRKETSVVVAVGKVVVVERRPQ